MHFTNTISILFILVFILTIQSNAQLFDSGVEDYVDGDSSAMNESLSNSSSTTIETSTTTSLSPIIKALSTSLSTINLTRNSIFLKNQSTSFPTSQKIPMTAAPVPPYILADFLVDQFNHYRNIDILSRIKQCDSKMKLDDMCETYSFDNHTYSLVRESNIEFQSLEHLYDALVDRLIVEKLNKICPTGEWCLGNLTQDNIRFTINVIQQRGRSFCSLENCHHRLAVYTAACPSMSTTNISKMTLKLLPMICALYEEQSSWNSDECIDQIGYLLHILYAFWPQIENCHHVIAAGSDGCTPECLTFDTILHKVENQCNENASFLTRVPALAWYRLMNLKQVCRHEPSVIQSPFISSMKSFVTSQILWYRFHQRPVYAALFIIVVICILISFSLCLYVMSKNDYDSNTRHFDDDYEYTRLHDSTFELGSNTDISNTNLSSSRVSNQSLFDLNGNHRLSEHHRLLYMES